MTRAIEHFFREFRDHQRKVQDEGRGVLTVYPSGRTERSYASAPYGEHALSAFLAAKHHATFVARLGKEVRG